MFRHHRLQTAHHKGGTGSAARTQLRLRHPHSSRSENDRNPSGAKMRWAVPYSMRRRQLFKAVQSHQHDDLPDYDTLMEKIAKLHEEQPDSYLYANTSCGFGRRNGGRGSACAGVCGQTEKPEKKGTPIFPTFCRIFRTTNSSKSNKDSGSRFRLPFHFEGDAEKFCCAFFWHNGGKAGI